MQPAAIRPGDSFRRCLIELDIAGMRSLWQQVAPNLPQPASDKEALIALHHARTMAQSVPFRLRAYSHRWLQDQGFPSGLPDELKPKAERIYPKIEEGVGVAALVRHPYTKILQGVMRDAVLECYAEGETEPAFVKDRMMLARAHERKKLGLRPELSR